ncbi:MAG: CHRD domain-containing protein [Gemmatimonas sp.]
MSHVSEKLFLRIAFAFTSSLLVFACGGSSGGTDAPSNVASLSLTLSSTDAIASLGDTRTVTAVAKDAAGATLSAAAITWTSSAPSVATVSGSGQSATVTAIGNGTATITASSGIAQNTASVTVTQRATVVGVTGVPTTLAPGATAQLAAEARDARGRVVPGATGFTFASSDESVAVVSPGGLVTAISPGVAQISSTVTVAGSALNGSNALPVAFPTTNNPAVASVEATVGNQFTPPTVTIATGGTVTWGFASVLHNVTFSSGGAPSAIPNTSGQQVSRTFPTAGRFDYDCTLHPGMTGTVIVQANGATPGFTAILNGANERPAPVTTAGAGAASFTVNGTTVSYVVTFSRLSGVPIMAHIHGPGNSNQSVAVLVDFPTAGQTQTNGVLTGTFNAASIRNAAVSLDSLFVLMRNGNAYVNVHTTLNSAGEIRGPLSVPQ